MTPSPSRSVPAVGQQVRSAAQQAFLAALEALEVGLAEDSLSEPEAAEVGRTKPAAGGVPTAGRSSAPVEGAGSRADSLAETSLANLAAGSIADEWAEAVEDIERFLGNG